jgi:hypothetical protein
MARSLRSIQGLRFSRRLPSGYLLDATTPYMLWSDECRIRCRSHLYGLLCQPEKQLGLHANGTNRFHQCSRIIFGEVIDRLLDGNMKARRNDNGWNYVEELARQMLLNPKKSGELLSKASTPGCLPGIKASVERAAALNAPKQAIMDLAARCKERGGFARRDYKPGQVAFHFDLPYVLMPFDTKYGPHTYMPCNRDYALLGELGKMTGGPFWRYEDHPERAWHFRRDPREIEGAWLDPPNVLYLYGAADTVVYKSARAFMERCRDRLRRALAEAVPGVGGLAPASNWN